MLKGRRQNKNGRKQQRRHKKYINEGTLTEDKEVLKLYGDVWQVWRIKKMGER